MHKSFALKIKEVSLCASQPPSSPPRRQPLLPGSLVSTIKNKDACRGFPGGAVVENLPANAGDTGSSPGLGGSHMPRSD